MYYPVMNYSLSKPDKENVYHNPSQTFYTTSPSTNLENPIKYQLAHIDQTLTI